MVNRFPLRKRNPVTAVSSRELATRRAATAQAEGVLLVHANRAILDADTAKQMVAMADGEVLGAYAQSLCMAHKKAIDALFVFTSKVLY